MASRGPWRVDNSKLYDLLETLSSIPPFDQNACLSYNVKGRGIETTVQASSSFEAAIKFSFLLLDLGLLRNGSKY